MSGIPRPNAPKGPGTTKTVRTVKKVTPSETSITSTTTITTPGRASSRLPGPQSGTPRQREPAAKDACPCADPVPGPRPPGGGGLRPPRAPGLRPPSAPGLKPPSAPGLRPPGAPGLRPPSAPGLTPPSAPGLRVPSAQGLRTPRATGLRPPAAPGLRPPAAPGLRPPIASGGLRPPSAPGSRPPSAPSLRPAVAAGSGYAGRAETMMPSTTTVDIDGQRVVTSIGQGGPPPAAPAGRMTKTETSQTMISGGKEVTTKKTVTRTASPQGPGHYYIPMRDVPQPITAYTEDDRRDMYSSPPDLRQQMEDRLSKRPPGDMIMPGNNQDIEQLLGRRNLRNMRSGNLMVPPRGPRQQGREAMLSSSFLNRGITDESMPNFSEDGEVEGSLERDVEKQLVLSASKQPCKKLKATGTRQGTTAAPVIMTHGGPIEGTSEVTISRSVVREPGKAEILRRNVSATETVAPGRAVRTELEVQKITSPRAKTSSALKGKEVVTVLSSVIIAEGKKQTTRTVSYDAPGPSKAPQLPSPREVAKLIEEETADIEKAKSLIIPDLEGRRPVTYGIKKKVELELLTAKSVTLLQEAVVPHLPNPDEQQEDAQPEMIAGILNTEERGLAMGAAPPNIYNYLFADQKALEPMVDVSSAAPIPLQDIVVPLQMPDQTQESLRNPEVVQASIRTEQKTGEPIPENIYVETVGKEDPKSTNTARKGPAKKIKFKYTDMLAKEIPPWGIQGDVGSVVDLVGAPPATVVAPVEEPSDEEVVEADPAEDGIEFVLCMEEPRHCSKVQLRGSQKPTWFPGYFLALPELPDGLTVVKSPSMVFSAAWKATYPTIFDDDSMFIA